MSAPTFKNFTAPNREIILGVGGGISAYKSCELLRRLQDHGFLVSVIPTRSSLNFVGKATWEALSGRPVQDELWNNVHEVPHIALAKRASAIVIAPATADLIARIAHGRADDMLTNVVIASSAPLILVPAMHTEMWLNSATVENVALLRKRGVIVVEPAVGKLTSGDVGVGRYPEISEIIPVVEKATKHSPDLMGKKVLISAGGTREKIDPVRYIGNHSSGKQGIALALAAASRGAEVSLVLANAKEIALEGVSIIHVESALEMQAAMELRFDQADIVVMSAAVADARPTSYSAEKLATSNYTSIDLVENPDIIAELATRKSGQFIIGFAAQTGDGAKSKANEKMKSKKLDLIYLNDVSNGKIFGEDETEGVVLSPDGNETPFAKASKMTLANNLLNIAIDKLG